MFVDNGLLVTAPVDDAGQLLLDAARQIEIHGWQQGTYGSPGFGFCARGAIRFAGIGKPTAPILGADYRLCCYLAKDSFNQIEYWNDTPGRTKEEVIAALRSAAHRVEPT